MTLWFRFHSSATARAPRRREASSESVSLQTEVCTGPNPAYRREIIKILPTVIHLFQLFARSPSMKLDAQTLSFLGLSSSYRDNYRGEKTRPNLLVRSRRDKARNGLERRAESFDTYLGFDSDGRSEVNVNGGG